MPLDALTALQLAWLANAVAAGIGLGWNVRLWWRWGQLQDEAVARHENGAVATALATRRRDAAYRVLLKAGLTSYALMRWEILTSVQPAILDGRQAVDVAIFSTIVVVLTIWSIHAWQAAWQRRRTGTAGGAYGPGAG